MKELTIEEKAKRYDEAIKRVVNIRTGKCKTTFMFTEGLFDYIFSELAESEDERIRKEIISAIKEDWPGHTDWIAWLEKQGEKGIKGNERKTPFLGQKPADKVEPKFKEGEWIIHHGTENIYQVVAIIDNQYQLKYGDNYTIQNCADVDRCARLWDITKDAKDGDFLVWGKKKRPFIFKGLDKFHPEYPVAYCGIDCDGTFGVCTGYGWWTDEECSPATLEQRRELEKAIANAGYRWDAEKRELIKVEQKELTKFESRLCEILDCAMRNPVDNPNTIIFDVKKKLAPELLDIARDIIAKEAIDKIRTAMEQNLNESNKQV